MSKPWFQDFPAMEGGTLRDLKRAIDDGFRDFIGDHGEAIERFFDPLKEFLIFFEKMLTGAPWPVVIAGLALASWLASRSTKITLGTVAALLLVGYFGMWDDTMKTVSMILASTLVALVLGLPIGILMARSRRLQACINPVLDVMQTMPSFVYLIPVVMLLGIGRVPGLLAVVVYAIAPIIRLSCLGIQQVDRDALEAADAFGSSSWQRLRHVQLPLALPTIMAGVNQTIMLALSMVVVASMIGVQGLGQPVLKAISNQYFALGVFNGLAIVGIAIAFDRALQSYGRRLQKHRQVPHG